MSADPPILPLYKAPKSVAKTARVFQCMSVSALIIVPAVLIVLFFLSIYVGTTYLHDHVQGEMLDSAILAGHPGTKNEIKKWSISHLGGIDITNLGPPALAHRISKVTTEDNTDSNIEHIPEDVSAPIEITNNTNQE